MIAFDNPHNNDEDGGQLSQGSADQNAVIHYFYVKYLTYLIKNDWCRDSKEGKWSEPISITENFLFAAPPSGYENKDLHAAINLI